jgi:phospholipase C
LLNAAGQPTSPFPFQTVCHDNLSAGWNTQHTEVDGGKMDLFIRSRYLGSTNDPNYTRGIGYYDEKDLPYYYELATQFAVSDRFFSSLLGPTNPNRFYLFSASSFGNVAGSTTPPAGGFTYPTIFDKLDAAGISWRMYYYDTSHLFLQSWANWWKWKANVFPISQYYLDVQSESTFPQFVFIERGGGVDEHPGADIDFGARNTKTYIDALMASPVWQSTVFFLTFDEGGGMYDHVYPPAMVAPDNIQPILSGGDTFMAGFTQAGLRIPLVVISPWVKPHYVSHVNRDLTALLKFVETRFNLTPLSNRDAAQDDMTEMFNFSAPFFATPPKLPAQNALHGCDFSLGKAPGQ